MSQLFSGKDIAPQKNPTGKKYPVGKIFVAVGENLTTNVKSVNITQKSLKRRKKGVVDSTWARWERGENGTFYSGYFEK
jgi:hypothetical protein